MFLTVRMDKENNRFYTRYNGFSSELRFKKITPKIYEFNFLTTGESKEQMAIEDELLYTAFLFAQKEGIKIIPGCEKVSEYLLRHKEFTCVTYDNNVIHEEIKNSL